MKSARAVICLLLFAVIFVRPSLAGQDLFGLDFDPVAELEDLGIDTSIQNLKKILLDDQTDPMIGYYSAIAIGQSSHGSAYNILVRALESDDGEVVIGAIKGLSELGDERATLAYAFQLENADHPSIRQAAVLALARQNSYEARSAISKSGTNPAQDRDVRISAILLLKRDPDQQSDDMMLKLSTSDDKELRARAIVALAQRYELTYDSLLIDLVADNDLPMTVWRDVVRHLERKSGTKFGSGRGIENPRISAEEKREIRRQVTAWWHASTESQQ